MAEYQRHPLARPHSVGQDFWAAGYAGPSLWDRKGYVDPRTGQVWESLEEALRFYRSSGYQQWDEGIPDDPNVAAVMPDIRSVMPPGPPGEAAFRQTQVVPSTLPYERESSIKATGLLEAPDTDVEFESFDAEKARMEEDLQRLIREEGPPQKPKTSRLGGLISQAHALEPLPPPPTREELWEGRIDRGLALQELLELEEASSGSLPVKPPTGPTQIAKPRIGPTQLEQPRVGPSTLAQPRVGPTHLEPPPTPVRLEVIRNGDFWYVSSGLDAVSGPFYSEEEAKDVSSALKDMLGDASISKYKEFGDKVGFKWPKKTDIGLEESSKDIKQTEEPRSLFDSIKEAVQEGMTNIFDYVPSVIDKSEASGTVSVRQLEGQEAADARRALPRTTFEKSLVSVGTFPNDTAPGRNAWYGKWGNRGNEKVGTAYLAPDAAADFKRMNKAFREWLASKGKSKRDITIEGAYRTNLHNEALTKQGSVRTSKHKEGTALDISSKEERDWIIKNGASKYGWIWNDYKDKKGKHGTSNHFYHIGKRKTTSR